MYNWYECKVRYDKTLDTGLVKAVTETYMIDALSFTEAEARIIEEMKPYISGAFSVTNIKKVKYPDTFFDPSGDRYYRAKLHYITLDEKSGAERKTAVNVLVQASELKEAVEIIEKEMKKTMIDYSIASVTETPVMDVFFYDGNKTKNNEEES